MLGSCLNLSDLLVLRKQPMEPALKRTLPICLGNAVHIYGRNIPGKPSEDSPFKVMIDYLHKIDMSHQRRQIPIHSIFYYTHNVQHGLRHHAGNQAATNRLNLKQRMAKSFFKLKLQGSE